MYMYRPSFACHPRRPFRMIKRKIGSDKPPLLPLLPPPPHSSRRLFSFVVPVLLIMDLSVRAKQNQRAARGGEKIRKRTRGGGGGGGGSEINYCTPSLFRGFIKLAKRNFMAATTTITDPCIGKPMMSKGIRTRFN